MRLFSPSLGIVRDDLLTRLRTLSLDQATGVEKRRFAQPRANKLQAGDRNGLVVHGNWYRQGRISGEIHRNGVLQDEHSRFQKGYFSDRRNRWGQRLKR